MKKTLEKIFMGAGIKKINLSSRALGVYEKWTRRTGGTERDFYEVLSRISSAHQNLYKKREHCGKKGHNEDVLSIDNKNIYAKCRDCGLSTIYDASESKFVDNTLSLCY